MEITSSSRRLLSRKEVSEWTGLTVGHLGQLAYLGTGPSFMKLGRRAMYDPADVQAWLEANKIEPGAAA